MPMTRDVHIRVDDNTWTNAGERASREGTTLSTLIRQWLQDYVNGGAVDRPRVHITTAEREAVREALDGLDIAAIVIDTVNKER